ncbi:hypothetical protein BDN67DRAFT_904842, partial [Paxillus ammoniavirescens]
IQYTAKVNVGGHGNSVVANIGSSDLWISSGQPIADNTDTDVNLTYGIGLAYDNVPYTPVSFCGYEIQHWTYAHVRTTADVVGESILGLESVVLLLAKTKIAQSIVANLLTQQDYASMLISLALERSSKEGDTSSSVLSIGEYDPRYVP